MRRKPSIPPSIRQPFETLERRQLFAAVPTGLTGEYFQGSTFATPVVVRTDAAVRFNWAHGRPDADVAAGGFSARWTGQVTPATTAPYTFTVAANATARLWVDGRPVVDTTTGSSTGTIALSAGHAVDLRLEYVSPAKGRAAVKLMWSAPQVPARVVPASALTPAAGVSLPTSDGQLVGTYYKGAGFDQQVMSRADPKLGFNWHTGVPDRVLPTGTPFSIRWTGTITVPTTDTYAFHTRADDGVRLWVNGQLIINDWQVQSATDRTGKIALVAGQTYPVRMDYFQDGVGHTSARLTWSAQGMPQRIVPFGAPTTVGAPANLVTRPVSSSEIDLTWDDVPHEAGFVINRSADNGATWEQVGTTPAGTTAFADTALPAATLYTYRVGAIAPDGKTTLTPPAAAQTALVPPADVAAVATGTTAAVTWDAVAGAAAYTVQRSPTGAGTWTVAGTVAAPALALSDPGLSAGTTYDYRVVAADAAGNTSTSTPASATTAPPTPTGVAAAVAGSTTALTWQPASAATAYAVERSTDGGTTWTAAGTTATPTFADAAPAAGTTVEYRVTASNAAGASDPSAPASASAAPAAATGIAAAASGTTITVVWAPTAGATGYLVERSPNGSANWTTAGTTTIATTLADPNLNAATTYYYRVTATGTGGAAAPSAVASATTAPAAPTAVTAIAAGTTITVAWAAAPAATGYTVQRSPDGVTGWAAVGTTAAPTVTLADAGLAHATSYAYRVIATNAAGHSDPSAVASATTAPAAPVATAVAAGRAITVTWPAVAGASAYAVERSPDGTSAWVAVGSPTSSTTVTDAGLAIDATYFYRVTATGFGGPSGPSAVVSATTVPAAPVVTATAAGTTITVAWAAVPNAATYEVDRSADGATNWTVAGTTSATTFADAGLATGTTYYYRAEADDAAGSSAPSNVDHATTGLAAPVPTATAAGTTITVAWPAATGATSYAVERSPDGTSNWAAVGSPTSATTVTDAGLAASTPYSYRVTATAAGLPSVTSAVVTAVTPPASPVPTATAVGTTINVAWPAVAGATQYVVERSDDGTTNWTTLAGGQTATAFADGLLPPAAAEYYRVTAVGVGGLSAASAVVSATTAPAAPVATATALGTTITVAWPAVTGASTYAVERSADGATGWAAVGTATSATSVSDAGLSTATTEYYRVTATGAGGASPVSAVVSATTPLAAPVPTATASVTTITVAWPAVASATGYTVERSPDGVSGWTTVGTTAGTTLADTGMWPDTTYSYRVTATAAGVPSATSAVVSVTTPPFAPMPQATAAGATITVAWPAVSGATGYTVERSDDGATNWTTLAAGQTATTLADASLPAGSTEYYRVTATGAGGTSPASAVVNATTAPAAPVPTASGSGSTYTVTWPAVPGATSYAVERSANGMTGWTAVGSATAATSKSDPGWGAGGTMYYRVTATGGGGASPASAVVSATLAPAEPFASATASGSTVTVTWGAVSGATSYTVERSADGSTGWAAVGGATSGTTVTDPGRADGSTTYYRVTASNVGGNSPVSPVVSATAVPGAPVLTLIASGRPATLSWAAVTGADRYQVERSDDGVTNWVPLGSTTTATSGGDASMAAGSTEYYHVIALNAAGQSGPSNVVSNTVPPNTPLLSLAPSGTTITASWVAMSGATGYTLERAASGSGPWSTIATTAATSVADAGLPVGTNEYYRVTATNGAGASAPSSVWYAATVPAAPAGLTATATGTTGNLSWTAAATATGYTVYRSAHGANSWASVGTTSGSTTAYADATLAYGTAYDYRVTATNLAGESGPSNVATVTTVPQAPTITTSTVDADNVVHLGWTDVTGEAGFAVQMSPNGTSGWATVQTTAAGTAAAGVAGLGANTTYHFRVVASGAAGDSAPSAAVSVATGATAPAYSAMTVLYGLTSSPGNVYSIDPDTGAATNLGSLSFGTNSAARDPVSGNFYYVSTPANTVQIATWNPYTGANTTLNSNVSVSGSVLQAAFRSDGVMFMSDSGGNLYHVNRTTGAAAAEGVVKVGGTALAMANGDMGFAPDGSLYLEVSEEIYKVTPAALAAGTGPSSTIVATDVGSTNTGSNNLQIAFGRGGVLYGYGGITVSGTTTQGQIYTIDTATGAATAVAGSTPSGVSMGDLASVPVYADLSVTASASAVTHGGTGTVTLAVANGGPDATVKAITVTDTLSAGLTFAGGSGAGWSFFDSGQTVTATYAGPVAAGASPPSPVLAVAVSAASGSHVTNTVSVTTPLFDPNAANNSIVLTTAVG